MINVLSFMRNKQKLLTWILLSDSQRYNKVEESGNAVTLWVDSYVNSLSELGFNNCGGMIYSSRETLSKLACPHLPPSFQKRGLQEEDMVILGSGSSSWLSPGDFQGNFQSQSRRCSWFCGSVCGKLPFSCVITHHPYCHLLLYTCLAPRCDRPDVDCLNTGQSLL